MTGGQALVQALDAWGVKVVFGIPGIHTLAIYDAFYEHPRLRHITARHEQGAGFMADGYARVSGKPGFVYGATDELGFSAVENPVHVHDFQATLMHLLGIDHESYTYKFQGRNYRLTDVHGHVVKDVLS